jgi:hypothetical protein
MPPRLHESGGAVVRSWMSVMTTQTVRRRAGRSGGVAPTVDADNAHAPLTPRFSALPRTRPPSWSRRREDPDHRPGRRAQGTATGNRRNESRDLALATIPIRCREVGAPASEIVDPQVLWRRPPTCPRRGSRRRRRRVSMPSGTRRAGCTTDRLPDRTPRARRAIPRLPSSTAMPSMWRSWSAPKVAGRGRGGSIGSRRGPWGWRFVW